MAKDRTTIGQMREQVAIMTVSSVPFDTFSVQNNYTVKYTLRARVRSMDRTESKRGIGFSTVERTHVVIIRNGSSISVDNDNLVRWNGDYYKILGTERISRNVDDPRKRFIRIEVAYSHEAAEAYNNPSPVGIIPIVQLDLPTIPDLDMLNSIPDETYIPLAS